MSARTTSVPFSNGRLRLAKRPPADLRLASTLFLNMRPPCTTFVAMPMPLCVRLQKALQPATRIQSRRFLSNATETQSRRRRSGPPPLPPSLSYVPTPFNFPGPPSALPAVAPSPDVLAKATALLTIPPPKFLYSASRFLHLPHNTCAPEVCVLGRSNVGKSTLINAMAGLSTSEAGRQHRSAVRGSGLAVTSARAGCTALLNAFGMGDVGVAATQRRHAEAAAERQLGRTVAGVFVGSASRKDKRAAAKARSKAAGPAAVHDMVLMDTPGYGLHSKSEWGIEVAKYLAGRRMLRGALVLVDAVTGPKDGDRQVLALLRDAGVRTGVVLTKADKLYAGGDAGGLGGERLRETCVGVWRELRQIEKECLLWVEGNGWEREIWATAAGDPKNGGLGVRGVRMALCKLAGLLQDDRAPIQTSEQSKAIPVSSDPVGASAESCLRPTRAAF